MNRKPGAPLRFLIGVIGIWVAGRGWFLSADDIGTPAIASSPMIAGSEAFAPSQMAGGWSTLPPSLATYQLMIALPPYAQGVDVEPVEDAPPSPAIDAPPLLAMVERPETLAPLSPASSPRLDLDHAVGEASRWSGSAWLFGRDRDAGQSLASAGQLGGSQAGAILRLRLNPGAQLRTALYGRASSPLDDLDGAEVAIGGEWHPLPGQPVWIAAERRIAVGKQGRNAWSAYAAGGIWKPGLPLGLTLDGYAQAGVVGARKRDLFADGSLRITRTVGNENGPRLGAGVWGAAQPGISRLDLGPHARLPLKVAKQPLSLAADYRIRVAGNAAPGSGVAVTLASDF